MRPPPAEAEDRKMGDLPPTPPNSNRPSRTSTRNSSARDALTFYSPEIPSSPVPPIELTYPQVKGSPTVTPRDSASNLARQFSTLQEQREYLKTHRDSLDLAHHRIDEHQSSGKNSPARRGPQADSPTGKHRLDGHVKLPAMLDTSIGHIKFGGLSPIADASPLDVRTQMAHDVAVAILDPDQLTTADPSNVWTDKRSSPEGLAQEAEQTHSEKSHVYDAEKLKTD